MAFRTIISRREFVALSLAGSVAVASPVSGNDLPFVESEVEVKTPDGTCDAAFIHPAKGSHPGVLIWPDSLGLRPVMRELGKRIAKEGYAVLVPNCFYRTFKAPVFDDSFDLNNPAHRERYIKASRPFLTPGAGERDAVAHVAFLDSQRQVNRKKKIGTHGYCLGGPFVLRTAAAVPERVGAGVSFHGGFLVTDKPNSPHLLAPKIKARLYFAIASDDDKREPEVKNKLKEAFANAEIELYPNALHGFCVPDSKAADNNEDVARAWSKLLALYKTSL